MAKFYIFVFNIYMRVNTISFTGHIIDSHVHAGRWWRQGNLYNHTPDIDTFIKQPLANGDTVDKVIVSNLDCMTRINREGENIKFISDELEGNKKLLELASNNKKIVPLVTCQPGYGTVDNIKQLFAQNPGKFAGLKFHPEQLNINADSDIYNPYMEFAKNKKLPCLFHSGYTFDTHHSKATMVSKPEQIYSLAKRYPDVPVVMAHLGGNEGENTLQAVECIINSVRNKDASLYADISWVDCDNPAKPTLKETIRRLNEHNALERIMFGTDAPIGRFGLHGENYIPPIDAYTNNINDIKSMIRREFGQEAENIIEKIFYQNANDLYIERKWVPSSKPLKSTTKTKFGVIAGLIAITIGIVEARSLKKKKQEPPQPSQVIT